MIIGVIPARGGSKGVPNKNIRSVLGKPLIAYAIECALNCTLLDRVIVSTDSEKIASIAREWGAEVPFIRPKELAQDSSPMLPVLQHCIISIEEIYSTTVKSLILLDPTGPLRLVDDIVKSYEIFRNSDCNAVISGNAAHRSPYFNMVKKDSGFVQLVTPLSNSIGRRQDAPEVFDLNTVVWIYSRKALMEEKKRIPQKTLLYMVPSERAIDIDTELDFKILEYLLKEKQLSTS